LKRAVQPTARFQYKEQLKTMKIQKRFISTTILSLCLLTIGMTTALAQPAQRDPLSGLKRAITQASAPALTAQQEADLTALITAYKDAQPDEPDADLQTAREAYDAAVLAGNVTAATAQAAIISSRQAALSNARLVAQATFEIAVLANLKAGGQFTALQTKLGDDRLLALAGSLAGGGGFGGPGGGPGGGHGGGHGRP
jgi:hypothetical protein